MKKTYFLIVFIVLVLLGLAFMLNLNSTRTIDWEESFNEKSNKPYGTSIFYKELKNIYKDKKIRTVYYTASNYLYANSEDSYGDHIAEGIYLKIGNSDYLDYDAIDELLLFVEKGNTLFISDYYIPNYLADSLKVDIDYAVNEKDSISKLSFASGALYKKNTVIDRNEGDFFFGTYDTENHEILGYTNNEKERVNFLKIPFKKGTIFLHLQPKSFTNYNLLKEDRYHYVEGILTYLPEDNIYFDSYFKYQGYYDSEVEQDSELSWFLEQVPFRWAWYTALLFTLLFIVFNAKRRQRIVAIVKPLKNTTVAFVKTISNLYVETQDHQNLIEKKITYFLEKVRTDYVLDTSVLNQEFIERLSLKSGQKKNIVKTTIDYIIWLRNKKSYSEQNLITLNKKIEEFYAR